jgi:hemolysin D
MRRLLSIILAAWRQEKTLAKPDLNAAERAFQPAAIEIVETPASPSIRLVACSLLGLIAITLAWSWFGRVDVTTSLTGKVIPIGKTKVVDNIQPGRVLAIHVQDGDAVSAGTPLITIDPTEAVADLRKAENELSTRQARQERLRLILQVLDQPGRILMTQDGTAFAGSLSDMQRDIYVANIAMIQAEQLNFDAEIAVRQAEYNRTSISIEERNKVISISNERKTIHDILLAQGNAAKTRYLDVAQAHQDQLSALAQDKSRLIEIQAAVASLETRKQERLAFHRDKINQEIGENERELQALRQDLAKLRSRAELTVLRASADGVVQQLALNTIGQTVPAGQTLAVIVPKHAGHEVEALLLNRDIGMVREGMPVQIKLEAFPFTEFGTLKGVVRQIAQDAVPSGEGGAAGGPARTISGPHQFPVRITLGSETLPVKGKTLRVTPGMSVMAEIKTDQRRIIAYFLDPVLKALSESIRER